MEKKTKSQLAFDRLEAEMEIISREMQMTFKGGDNGNTSTGAVTQYLSAVFGQSVTSSIDSNGNWMVQIGDLNPIPLTFQLSGVTVSPSGAIVNGDGTMLYNNWYEMFGQNPPFDITQYSGGGGTGGGSGGSGNGGSSLNAASLMAVGLINPAFAEAVGLALAPFAEILVPIGIIGFFAYAILDPVTKVYSYDRGQPWQEPSNPYNNSGGMDPFPNGDDFSTGIKVALTAVGLAALYDEMADYFGWPSWSNPNPTPVIPPQPVP